MEAREISTRSCVFEEGDYVIEDDEKWIITDVKQVDELTWEYKLVRSD